MRLLCLLALTFANWAPAQGQPTFDELLSDSESRQYRAKPDYPSRMEVVRKTLGRHRDRVQLEVQNKQYGKTIRTLAAMRAISQHGLKLTNTEAEERDFRSKKVRKLEIQLRKMAEMLDDLKSAPPFEYRPHFDSTVLALSSLRDRLLEGYFQDSRQVQQRLAEQASNALHWAAVPVSSQHTLRSTVSGDQFTFEEEEAIRDAQELRPRVKVLIEIAQTRLDEIARRLSQRPWEKEKPNPLEFFTYAQLTRAYYRALEVMMINVDEKARLGLAKPKDIRKSLQLVNSKMQEFIPQLEPIRSLAIEKQDEDLFVEVRKAKRVSDQALKGSQLGLGAPAQGDS